MTKKTKSSRSEVKSFEVKFAGQMVTCNPHNPQFKRLFAAQLESTRAALPEGSKINKGDLQKRIGLRVPIAKMALDGSGTLTHQMVLAAAETVRVEVAMLVLSKEERDDLESKASTSSSNVTSMFPKASVKTDEGDEPINWEQVFAKLWNTGNISNDVVQAEICEHLLAGKQPPYRELVLGACVEYLSEDASLAHLWREPPFCNFLRKISALEMRVIEDVLAQKAEAARVA